MQNEEIENNDVLNTIKDILSKKEFFYSTDFRKAISGTDFWDILHQLVNSEDFIDIKMNAIDLIAEVRKSVEHLAIERLK